MIKALFSKIGNISKFNFWNVFIGLFIYQIFLIFQGFDLCDSGFYATFYQNIFTNPSCVEYNFLCWLTGILGGLFIRIFPESGLLGIRLLGVANLSAIIYVVYRLLNRHVSNVALFVGLIVVTISFVGMPTEFFHNNLSSFLFVCAAFSLFEGLERNKAVLISLSGILLTLNLFARLPNILDIGLIIIIFIYGYYHKESKSVSIKRALILLSCYMLTIISVLGLMKLLGHYEIFIRNLAGLKGVAMGNTNDTHGLAAMIIQNLNSYKRVAITGFYVAILMLIIAYSLSLLKSKNASNAYKWLAISVTVLLLAYVSWKFRSINLLYFFSLIALCWNIYAQRTNIKILSWIGLFMLIVMPLGSDLAINNFGNYSLWIAVPLMLNHFFTEELALNIKLDSIKLKKRLDFQLDNHSIKLVLFVFLIVFISTTLYKGVNTAYFDPGSRIYKTYKINNPKTRGIFTTKERAGIVNDLLTGIAPYIRDGDYLIAYESIPMIHYLTNTKPFLYDSWLVGTMSVSLNQKIERAFREHRPLPLVLRQKFETIAKFGIPSDEYLSDDRKSTTYVSQEQTRMFNKFLAENNYKIIWSNTHFVLYEPQGEE